MAELDPEKVGQSGVDPITGSVLSKEVREALVKKTTVDSSVFKSEIANIENKRSQEELQNLRSIQGQEQSLFTFNSSVESLRTDINKLGTGLSTIALLLQQDNAEERNRIETEQEKQRILTERQVRIGKESEIEKKIQNAVLEPVQKLAPKVQNIFGEINTALALLFGGWLTNESVKAIQASEEGNTELFNDIKGNILKNIGIAAGGLLAIRTGFSLITRTIAGLASGLTRLLVIKPIEAASILFGNLMGGMRNAIPGLPNTPRTPTTPSSGGGFLSLIGKMITGASGVMNFLNGENIDTVLSALTFVPGGGIFRGLRLAAGTIFTFDQIAEFLGSNLTGADPEILRKRREELDQKKKESTGTPPASVEATAPVTPPEASTAASTTPEVTPIPQQPLTGTPTLTPPTATTASTQPTMSNAGVTDYTNINQSQSQPTQSTPPLAQISIPPKEPQRVGQLPPPTPEVTIIKTANTAQSQASTSTSIGPLTDVPLINSSNPDNFYVLYSQLNYNIVTS